MDYRMIVILLIQTIKIPFNLPNPHYKPKTITSTDSNHKFKTNNSLDSQGSDAAAYLLINAEPAAIFSACLTYATAFKEVIMPVIVITWTVSTVVIMWHVECAVIIIIVLNVLYNVADIYLYAFFWIV